MIQQQKFHKQQNKTRDIKQIHVNTIQVHIQMYTYTNTIQIQTNTITNVNTKKLNSNTLFLPKIIIPVFPIF